MQRETTPFQGHSRTTVSWDGLGWDIKPILFMAGTPPTRSGIPAGTFKRDQREMGINITVPTPLLATKPPKPLPRQGEVPQFHCRIPYVLHWQEHFCTSGVSIFILRSLIIT